MTITHIISVIKLSSCIFPGQLSVYLFIYSLFPKLWFLFLIEIDAATIFRPQTKLSSHAIRVIVKPLESFGCGY